LEEVNKMSERPLVVPLREARDLSLTGGKAINLAKMIAADLPVPDGFVVTTAAYQEADDSMELPEEVALRIREEYTRMGLPMVAARSSATAEDLAGASMAGQYETFLNLSSIEELLEAVSGCWKSMRSERLQAYLKEQGIDPEAVSMAVVVQELVPAEAAGVLFTANPRTGSTDEMLIEAAWGLGEGVVSGAVQPDRVRLRSKDGEVIKYEVTEKLTRLVPGGKGFEDVAPLDRSRACLSYEATQELWRLGRRAMAHFDGEQDMEWALAGGKISLLQSRAITTLKEAAIRSNIFGDLRSDLSEQLDRNRGPWVRHNLDETLPNPTPLSWSLLRQFMSGQGGYGEMYREVGFEPSDAVCEEGFLELIGGRIYMDCSRMPKMFSGDYPFDYDVELLRRDPDAAQLAPTLVKGSMSERAEAAGLAKKVTVRLHEIAKDLDRRFDEEFVPEVTAWCKDEGDCSLTFLDRESLGQRWEKMRSKVLDEFGVMAFLPSMIEALATSELLAFLEEHSWDEDPNLLVNQLVVSEIPDQTFRFNERLQEVGKGTLSLGEWLVAFGFRAPGEFDLANPRWHERPGDLEDMAKRLAGEGSLRELHEKRLADAQEAKVRILSSLDEERGNELEKRIELACRYVRFREDGKCQLMRAYTKLRGIALEIGSRLGIGEEVFFLENDEMIEALNSGFVFKDRIERRRIQQKVEGKLSLPRVIDRNDLEGLGEVSIDEDVDSWEAHSLSSGITSGKVRIVASPESAGDLGDDYLLVCSSTDPSWTPLFVGANGLILERGGSLSHGAIVARELGLPAVVLENATRIFEDGDELFLDANRGKIIRGGREVPEEEAGIEYHLKPPLPGTLEKKANSRGGLAAIGWSAVLAAVWFLPAAWLQEPLFAVLDFALWPLVKGIGKPATVGVIAAFFAVVPLLLQKRYTDNERLLVAKERASALRSASARLPKGSARQNEMNQLAGSVTFRVLKAAMTSLAFVLGPMMLIFLWLPARLDPASWNSEPGQMVSILAEVDGDWREPLTLEVPTSLKIDSTGKATQTLKPIRETLETIRAEWAVISDTSDFPWEIQASASQAHQMMLASLNQFLAQPSQTQKISWRIEVPEDAYGHHELALNTGEGKEIELKLAFGKNCPPAPVETLPGDGPVRSLKAIYPRALTKNVFWSPAGTSKDFGWLGVYLLVYLPVMVMVKKVLKVA